MAYVSLYRRYRPQTFADIVGQDHVTRTIVNAIAEDRLHHAYLFAGPRGTGKTSTARILAKAINCASGPTADPCNTCDSCREITDGTSVDVIELDMASHGGVDDARELRDRALFAPARSRRKVYILDEVHMASTAAFNALLKLIEEPPGHVLFAMATTDPQKVLPTILSRVQRLDLRRVDAAAVGEQVRRVCAAEGYEIEPAAVDQVVRAGDGSVRDTLSVLEQVLAFAGSPVSSTDVRQVLGGTPDEQVIEVVDRILAGDVGGLLVTVQELVDGGHDLRRFALDLAQHVRDVLALAVAPDHPELVDATVERRARVGAQAARIAVAELVEMVRVLGATVAEQRQTAPRLPLELALADLAVTRRADGASTSAAPPSSGDAVSAPAAPRAEDDAPAQGSADPTGQPVVASAEARPSEVSAEALADAGDPIAAAPAMSAEDRAEPVDVPPRGPAPAPLGDPAAEPADDPAAEPAEVPSSDPAAEPADEPADEPTDEPADDRASVPTGAPSAEDLDRVREAWPAVLEAAKQQSRRCHALFQPAVPTRVGRGILTLRYGRRYASFHAANAQKGEFADVIRAAVRARCGLDLRLEIVVEGEDDRRRPLPQSVTPDAARTAVPHPPIAAEAAALPADHDDGDDEIAVREAELSDDREPPGDIGSLLADELGAQLIEERPAGQ